MLSNNRRMRLPGATDTARTRKMIAALCFVLFALAGYAWLWAAVGSPSASAAAPPGGQPAAPLDTPTSTPTQCPPNWTVVSSPNSGSSFNELNGVAVVSANDIWAVGDYTNSNVYQTLTEHWNGTSWTVVSSPSFPNGSRLLGVSAVSTNDVWAVGTYSSDGSNFLTLTEHWNGSSWSVVSSPNPSTTRTELKAVAAGASNDVWAVGD